MEWPEKVVGACLLLACVGCVDAQSELDKGEELFAYCTQCHGDAGEGNPEFRTPAIAGLPRWYVEAQLHKFRIGARGDHPEDLDGLRMRPMSRTLANDGEVAQVSAYVASLPANDPQDTLGVDGSVPMGDAERGRALFTPCVECHGERGQGKREMNAPPLVNHSDWYLFAQLVKFKAGIRGADTLDTSGGTMRPMAIGLADEQAMRDVVAYIETFDE